METLHPWNVEWVSLDRLHLSPANPRKNEPAVEHVAASLRRFGWQQPVVARRSGEVIAGNTRLKAAKQLEMNQVPVVWFEGTDLEATAYSIADNRTGELSEWESEGLAKLLDELRAEDALEGVGFTDAEVDELLAQIGEGPGEVSDPGPGEPPKKPIAKPGDVWVLGDHRLLCGDSTNPEDVARIMDGEKAALVATDPPFLVGYTGERPNGSGKDWTRDYREIDIKDAEGFFRAIIENVKGVMASGAALYLWHAHKRCGDIQRILRDLGFLDHQQIIWVKPTPAFGRAYWPFRHEPCLMAWIEGKKPRHDGDLEFDSVWEVDFDGKARRSADHPTSKPLELFARPMRKHTQAGDVVFEPFSGSGSQIIAAEQLGRKCRAIEISPAFVDVAVRRWEAATGQQSRMETSG